MLEIRHLTCGYPDRQVLTDFSASLPAESLTAVIGPNGCGKSTLLKAVTGILPASGQVLFRGTCLTELPDAQRARQLAFLPQNRPLPQIPAGKLVLHGRFPHLGYPRRYRDSDKVAALQAMDRLGIRHLQHREMQALSGGERQKVYIAMLLAQEAPILLMDEPTTYLDIAHKFEMMDIARQLVLEGKTVIAVLHDLDLAMTCADRILLMKDEQAAACGTPEEIYRSGQLEQVFGIRAGRIETPRGIQCFFQPQQ